MATTSALLPRDDHRSLVNVLLASVLIFHLGFGHAATLPPAEVATLRKVASSLGKLDWNFDVNPCGGVESGWITHVDQNNVTCDCTFSDGTVCHVTNILLKSQSLPGFLPPELADLPFIQEIDLTRNYLSGTIPPEWGSTRLVTLSLLVNRLSGSIPVLEANQLSGHLPPALGKLSKLWKLHLASNNFTGEIPMNFSELTALKDFRLGDNLLSGTIPNFIQNWTVLTRLALQGSGLAGPIPSGISLLANLTDLRITDLEGKEEDFPSLEGLNLETLILRSCNLVGELPSYLGNMKSLVILDLSFNKLRGLIPNSFSANKIGFIYLTGNSLNGTVPTWMMGASNVYASSVDISYNNFSLGNGTSRCKLDKVNLFGNPLITKTNESTQCSRSGPCRNKFGSFSINCGRGPSYNNGSIIFERDIDVAGSSSYSNWELSNTGHFLDDNKKAKADTETNYSALSSGTSQLDIDARISAISLTYSGFCLENGNYTIDLYFTEIAFSNDKTYSSLGQRIFDVYIQGKLELKNFNIAASAGGNGIRTIKTFVRPVVDGTLEIRFQWAGKGTTSIPGRGVYGPLISAISARNPNFITPESGLSTGAIIGIVLSVTVVLLLLVGVLWWKFCLQKVRMAKELRGLDLKTGSFTLRQLIAATNNFDPANKIGEGGFGPVFKGHLSDGTIIAVKKLSSKSKQGNREFVNEIGMISALQHPHLVKLYGCCIEGNQLFLIYEYMENNSLARALFANPEESKLHLDWPTRYKICIGIAQGLAFLHEESVLKIVHRDIKATNVLLDTDLTPKISDFGLAKLDEEDNTHINTRIAGTFGYMAPEYATRGYLTDKADVYSFGIVALEIVSGRSNTSYQTKEDCVHLLDWAIVLEEKGQLMDLIDPRLNGDFNKDEVMRMIKVSLLCTNVHPAARPIMSSVVSILEGKTNCVDMLTTKETSSVSLLAEEEYSEVRSDGPWSSASVSFPDLYPIGLWSSTSTSFRDLYPINPDSDYWHKRENTTSN